MSINFLSLIVVQIIVLSALMILFRKMMLATSIKEVKRLQDLKKQQTQRSKEHQSQIETTEKEGHQKLLQAEKEANKILSEAKKEAAEQKNSLLSEARNESDKIVQKAQKAKEGMKEELRKELIEETAFQASFLVQKLLSSKYQKTLHEGFLEDFLEELQTLDEIPIERSEGALTIVIRTPQALKEVQKEKISRILSKKTGQEIVIQEEVNTGHVCGIALKIEHFLIDGTLTGKLKELSKEVKE